MFSRIVKSSRLIIEIFSRSLSFKPPQHRSIPPQLRFYLDTKSVFGSQKTIRTKRSTKPSELDLFNASPKKTIFERDTELLYGNSEGFHRACSVPKGVPISERQRYIRHLFRIPRGQPASLYPQAYIPNKYLGIRRKKTK
jgi:hypothetical protein